MATSIPTTGEFRVEQTPLLVYAPYGNAPMPSPTAKPAPRVKVPKGMCLLTGWACRCKGCAHFGKELMLKTKAPDAFQFVYRAPMCSCKWPMNPTGNTARVPRMRSARYLY